jgi:hypothetical protein
MSDPNVLRPQGAIRRAKARLARYANAPGLVALHLVRGLVEFSETKLGEFVTMLSVPDARELARRQRERPRAGALWFTADEFALVEVLANLIVPSDEIGPGAEQMAALGRSTGQTLDRLVAGSQRRQAVYGRGLVAFDRLAKDRYRSNFADLSQDNQAQLLRFLDRLHQQWSDQFALPAKLRARTSILYHKWSGLFPAVELFPALVQDVFQAFYTDRLSWAWLDYDGPPMPAGYPDLLHGRSR